MEKVVRAGLRCIPSQSQYTECIRDVLTCWGQYPDDWQKTWNPINEKYNLNPNYRRFSCRKDMFNIDAKINGAFIVMGLLYGEGDPDETVIIPVELPQPGVFEQCWEPGPVAESRFTPEEMKKIEITPETEKRR